MFYRSRDFVHGQFRTKYKWFSVFYHIRYSVIPFLSFHQLTTILLGSAPTQWLDGKHTIFGRVHSGMAVVKRIGLVETDKDDRPVDDVKILKCFVKFD